MMNETSPRDTGRLALAIGLVAAGSPICLAIYYAVQGPFGTINDVANAGIGLLSALLAWRLRGDLSGRLGDVAVGAALVGAALTVVGSSLVVSGTTGFFFAGLLSSIGFAGIGAWLLALTSSERAVVWPGRLRNLGRGAGLLMALGVAVAPGIPLGLDDMATAPGWVWVGFIGWLGTYVAYPAWAIWMGLFDARANDRAVRVSGEAGA
jgi:hypothetical protein